MIEPFEIKRENPFKVGDIVRPWHMGRGEGPQHREALIVMDTKGLTHVSVARLPGGNLPVTAASPMMDTMFFVLVS